MPLVVDASEGEASVLPQCHAAAVVCAAAMEEVMEDTAGATAEVASVFPSSFPYLVSGVVAFLAS